MQYNYYLKLKTLNRDLTEDTVSELFGLFKQEPLFINKYDEVERCKKEFTIENLTDIHKKLKTGIIFKGKGKGLSTVISAGFDDFSGLMWWTFFFKTTKPLTLEFFESIIAPYVQLFHHILPVVQGCFTSYKEYDALHEQTEFLEGIGSKTSWTGISKKEFSEFLPGIYWYNFFGAELINAIGSDKIKALKGVNFTEFKNGAISFRLNETADAADLETRTARLYNIAKELNEKYFFNRTTKEQIQFEHASLFKQYLQQVKNAYLESGY